MLGIKIEMKREAEVGFDKIIRNRKAWFGFTSREEMRRTMQRRAIPTPKLDALSRHTRHGSRSTFGRLETNRENRIATTRSPFLQVYAVNRSEACREETMQILPDSQRSRPGIQCRQAHCGMIFAHLCIATGKHRLATMGINAEIGHLTNLGQQNIILTAKTTTFPTGQGFRGMKAENHR